MIARGAPRPAPPGAASSGGFTLLELLLAAALTSVLMLGVLGVVRALGAAKRARAGDGANPARVGGGDQWLELLKSDLRHARRVLAAKRDRVTFLGPAALDARGRERLHRPVRVTYRIERIGGRSWLIRRQTARDATTNRNVQRDLVRAGVTGFALESLDPAARQGGRSASSPKASSDPERDEGGSDTDAGRSERGTGAQKPPGASGDAGGDASSDGEKESVYYNGLMFYREHLPPAVRRKLGGDAEDGEDGARSSGASRKAAVPTRTVGPGPWRFRVWIRGGGERPITRRIGSE